MQGILGGGVNLLPAGTMQAAKLPRPQGRKGSLRRLSGEPARKTSGLPLGQADVLVLITPIKGRVMAEGLPLNSCTGLHP